ncbi:MAG: cofactor-independent phosphoglycerate mutase [Thermodesulfobacteriota bacterium]
MKYIILVGDGMGDFPIAELNNRTPLEAADTPWLDKLCTRGEFFLTRTVPEGYPPGSDVANLSLLGYPPETYYTGRAPLEAAAMGIKLDPDQTAFRCNLVTIEEQPDELVRMIDYSAGHIDSDTSRTLIQALNEHCRTDRFEFYAGISYRHILLVRGSYPELAPVPPHDYIEKDVTEAWNRYMADPEWKTLVKKAAEVLREHPLNRARVSDGINPANSVWLWGEGKLPTPPGLNDRFGLTGSLISAVDLLKGLAVVSGLEVLNIPGATGYIDTNYAGKAEAALNSLERGNFVYVHVEAPDEAGHQGSLEHKMLAIKDFDEKIVGPIVEGLEKRGEDFRLIATMDHFTPLSLRTHTDSPVPTLLYDSRETTDGSGLTFNERNGEQAAEKGNYVASGEKLMEKLTERSVSR